ncbi:MAG: peptide chain release factor N(5)-glutamine methyltransferase [Bacteroidota bacterium]
MAITTSSKVLYQKLCKQLRPAIRDEQERQAIARQLLMHYFQVNAVQLALDAVVTTTTAQQQCLEVALQRLAQQEPLQYVLGIAHFFGRDFYVNPSVLIPRPETELLVQHIIEEHAAADLRILDIGTGSGCIAITLQQELPETVVDALDLSPAALKTARTNATKLGAAVQFYQADILNTPLPDQRWDLIVSNPPYVRQSEKKHMQRRVLDYEPADALFVPDKDPLLFHKRITVLAAMHLAPRGKLYIEINEAFGSATAGLLEQHGCKEVRIGQDLQGKDRWVMGSL